MLIFHAFKSKKDAEAFTKAAEKRWNSLHCSSEGEFYGEVFDGQDASNEVDPFPFELTPPIVVIVRGDSPWEASMEELVEDFAGRFAGT